MSALPDNDTLLPGFAEPVHDAQAAFRAALDALARPGRLQRLNRLAHAPAGLRPAAAALLLALADYETPLWLDAQAQPAAPFLRFHTGAPLCEAPADAAFAVVGADAQLPALREFALGSDAQPERSTTVIVEVAALREGGPWRLSGPGIEREHRLTVEGLRPDFIAEWNALRALFPRGVDLLLTCGETLCGLPRTTAIEG